MKGCVASFLAFGILAHYASAIAIKRSTSAVNFGPRNCVGLTQSAGGSCVITTHCEGLDTTKTEFAFDCVAGKGIVRHSFGLGGFDDSEEFDTEVVCDSCQAPTHGKSKQLAAAVAAASGASKAAVTKVKTIEKPAAKDAGAGAIAMSVEPANVSAHGEDSDENSKTQPIKPTPVPKKATEVSGKEPETNDNFLSGLTKSFTEDKAAVVKYGPQGCVSVYKNKESHCIMSTHCSKEDISGYEFGLVCVDKVGSPVKHLFGKDSFDPVETFDTLIKCEQCLGLENVPDSITLAGEVASMQSDLANLNIVVKNISVNVQMLNDKVFKDEGKKDVVEADNAGSARSRSGSLADEEVATAPAPAVAIPGGPPAALVHKDTHHRRHHLRHHRHHHHNHHRRHHRREYDDDDDSYDGDEEEGYSK